MNTVKFVVPQLISLKDREELSERWVEDRLVENPALLGTEGAKLRFEAGKEISQRPAAWIFCSKKQRVKRDTR